MTTKPFEYSNDSKGESNDWNILGCHGMPPVVRPTSTDVSHFVAHFAGYTFAEAAAEAAVEAELGHMAWPLGTAVTWHGHLAKDD